MNLQEIRERHRKALEDAMGLRDIPVLIKEVERLEAIIADLKTRLANATGG